MAIRYPGYPLFSDSEYRKRWARIRTSMASAGLDCLLIYGAYGSAFGSDPGQANLRYVTGFVDQFQAWCVFPLEGDPVIVNSFAGHIATGKQISPVQDFRFAGFDMAKTVASVVRDSGFDSARIGIVGALSDRRVSVPHEQHVEIVESLPRCQFALVTELMETLRRIKSDEEIAFLRRAAAATDAAYGAAVAAARPGARDCDLYEAIVRESHRDGGTLCFALLGSTPMATPAMVFPNAYISDRSLVPGDVVLSEHSSCYGGYSGQLLRTAFTSRPTASYERMYALASDVFERLLKAVRAGATTTDIHAAAQPIIDAGLTVRAPLVHGWGNFLEPPNIGFAGSGHPVKNVTLEKGQTIVIQPNPCTRDGTSGVILGELCIVTEAGAESLHGYPKEPVMLQGFN